MTNDPKDPEEPGTEVAIADKPKEEGTSLEALAREGNRHVQRRKLENKVFRQLQGASIGGFSMARLSDGARHAFAVMCIEIGADPLRHFYWFDGPYLNGDYWGERIADDRSWIATDQIAIHKAHEETVRDIASRRADLAKRLPEGHARREELILQSVDLEVQADEIAFKRSSYAVPDAAAAAYETIITRWMPGAPLALIQSGKMLPDALEKWKIRFAEANFAGGGSRGMKNGKHVDPVGQTNPDRTARTRSLRRAAQRAFPAKVEAARMAIDRAEDMIEADYKVLTETLLGEVVVQEGEPRAALQAEAEEAEYLPGRKVREDEPPPQEEPPPPPEEDEMEGETLAMARGGFFATLKDAGIGTGEERKKWAAANGLPSSTKDWGMKHFDHARDLLIKPTRDDVLARVKEHEIDLEQFSQAVIGLVAPEYLKHYKALQASLDARYGSHGAADAQEAFEL